MPNPLVTQMIDSIDTQISKVIEVYGERTFYANPETGDKYVNIGVLNSISVAATLAGLATLNEDPQYQKLVYLLVGLGHAAEGRTLEEVMKSGHNPV